MLVRCYVWVISTLTCRPIFTHVQCKILYPHLASTASIVMKYSPIRESPFSLTMLRFATSPCVLPAGERFGNRCLRVTVPSKAERGPEQPEVNSVGRRLAFNDLCVHVQARSHSPRERCPSTMPYLALYGGASETHPLS
ncbi:hypothetical protein V8E55_008422 [Tylopilus felleus]